MNSQLSEPLSFDSPIGMLRSIVEAFNNCREYAIDGFTIPELINIYHCWMRCGWMIYPDEWTSKQIAEAKQGICPEWDRNGKPVYAKDRGTRRRVTAIAFRREVLFDE